MSRTTYRHLTVKCVGSSLHKYIDGYEIWLSPAFGSFDPDKFKIDGDEPWEVATCNLINGATAPIDRIEVGPERVVLIYKTRFSRQSEVVEWGNFSGVPERTYHRNPLEPINNFDRANSAGLTLAEFRKIVGQEQDPDVELSVQDLLCDLMHYCHTAGVDFDHHLNQAREHYVTECEEECKLDE